MVFFHFFSKRVFILLSTSIILLGFSGCSTASESWDRNCVHDFQGGLEVKGNLENLTLSESGYLHLPVKKYFGNDFVIRDYRTDNTKLTSREIKLSFRFVTKSSKKLVRVLLRIYQHGSGRTWNFRLEDDEMGKPSGDLAWPGARGSAYIDSSGKIEIDLSSPGTVEQGNAYHFVISASESVNSNSYINPHTPAVASEKKGTGAFYSKDRGNSWSSLSREPVYVLYYSDGSGEGNPYYIDGVSEVYGSSKDKEANFVGQVISPGSESGELRDIMNVGFMVRRNGNPKDNLYFWIYDLAESEYLIDNTVISDNSVSEEVFEWQDVSFQSLDFEANRNYLFYLSSPGSGEAGYELKTCKSYSANLWSNLTYGGRSSLFVESRSSGEARLGEDIFGVSGIIFEKEKNEDLTFRIGSEAPFKRGVYTSPVIDAKKEFGAEEHVGWKRIYPDFSVPENTLIQIETRSGDWAGHDVTWNGWKEISSSGEIFSSDSRYLQYRATFARSENLGSPVLREIKVEVEDVVGPSFLDFSPVEGEVIAKRNPEIRVSTSDDFSGVDHGKVRMWINGDEVLTSFDAGNREIRYNIFRHFEMENIEVKLRVFDRAGNSATRSWHFKIDRKAVTRHLTKKTFLKGSSEGVRYEPVSDILSLENSSDGYHSEGNFVSPIFDVGTQVGWGQFWMDRKVSEGTGTFIEFRSSVDNLNWSDWVTLGSNKIIPGVRGRFFQYRISLFTDDKRETPELRRIGVAGFDVIEPEVEPISSLFGGSTNSSRPLFSVHVADDLSGISISRVKAGVDGTEIEGLEFDRENNRVWFRPKDPLSEGRHTFSLYVEDREGNSSSNTWQFRIDITEPELKVSFPISGYETDKKGIPVRGIVSEPSAKVFVEGSRAVVKDGCFEENVMLFEENNKITVVAVDNAGNRSKETVTVNYVDSIWILENLEIFAYAVFGLIIGFLLSHFDIRTIISKKIDFLNSR